MHSYAREEPAGDTAAMGIELNIIRLFDSNLRGFFTINQIAQRLSKAYPYINRKVHGLLELGVLQSVQVGGSHLCTLNLRNRRAVLFLTEIELGKRSQLPHATIELTRALEHDGHLAIETVVAGNGAIYLVGQGSYPGTTTVTADALKALLLETDLFKDHVVLHGYERFFAYLAAIQSDLDHKYNPLVAVRP